MRLFRLFLCGLLVFSWSQLAVAAPTTRAAAKKRPGLFKRLRRARTRPKPRHFQLLRLVLAPDKLFTKGKFTYWNPRGKQRKAGQLVYRFRRGNFARKTKGALLTKKGAKYRPIGVIVKRQALVAKAKLPKDIASPVIQCRILRRYTPPKAKQKGHKSRPIYLGPKPASAFSRGNVGHWASMHLSQQRPMRLEKGRLIVSMSKGTRRSAQFYKVSLPASVYKDYQKSRAKGLKAAYLVRFRITGYHVKTWYPKKHWMPHPHGGFRTYTLFGR